MLAPAHIGVEDRGQIVCQGCVGNAVAHDPAPKAGVGVAHLVRENVIQKILVSLGFSSRAVWSRLLEKSGCFGGNWAPYRAIPQVLLEIEQVVDHLVGQLAGGFPILGVEIRFGCHPSLLKVY